MPKLRSDSHMLAMLINKLTDYEFVALIDITTGLLTLLKDKSDESWVTPSSGEHYPTALCEAIDALIAKEDAARALEEMNLDHITEALQSRDSYSCAFPIVTKDGGTEYKIWTYTWLDDEHKAIVYTRRDETDQREKDAVYRKWRQSFEDRDSASYTLCRGNISNNTASVRAEGSLLDVSIDPGVTSFDEQAVLYAKEHVFEEDYEKYVSFLNAESLIAKYNKGERAAGMEYREKLPDGSHRWIRLTVEMVQYPHSSEIEAFAMFEDIDRNKKAELIAVERAETDPLTGVLNRTEFAARCEELFRTSNDGVQHALLMLDIDGFKLLNDTLGHDTGDQALVDTASSLRSMLRREDLLGRYGGDEFLICIRDMPYEAVIKKKAAQICSLLRKSYNLNVQTSASVGIAVFPRDGRDYDTLFRKADTSLYNVKSGGKDSFAFFSQEMEQSAQQSGEGDEQDGSSVAITAKKRMLIVDDNKMNCALLAGIFKNDFAVDTVNDGRTALIRMRRYGVGISVVLLDLAMPGIDGYTVLQKMRDSAEMRSIPVIVVSGAEDPNASLRAIEQGASDFVSKPVDPRLIHIRVQSAISRAENERLRAQNSYLLLQSSEETKYRTVIESTETILIEYDWVNSVFLYDSSISKYLAGQYDGRRLWRIMLSDRVADVMDVKEMQEFVHTIANDRERTQGEMRVKLKTAGGEKHWFQFRVYKKQDSFKLVDKLLLTFNDIDAEVRSDERLRYQAERDSLTGLYNRDTFFAMAEKIITGSEPGRFIIASYDIDNFKVFNDQYGTEAGDRALKLISKRAREIFERVGGICARVSADNFAALYPSGEREMAAVDDVNNEPIILEDMATPLVMSTGRYVIYDTSLPVDAMYNRAFLAKQSIKGRYDKRLAYFDESMRENLLREQAIVNEMTVALKDGQYEVWFQPQYNHATGALIGAEALVRWRHPTKGLVPPGDFIKVFERNGFIYELDKFVWERVCVLLRRWMDEGRNPLPVSVNISRYDIFRDDLTDVITGLVKRYRIPVEMLRLEITESAFATSTEQIISVVEKLISHGFTVEIDDFGSGYSSLNTLKNVPAHIIKLDMRFLEDTGNSSRGGNIVESIVRMAKWLGMPVIAEGVETIEQADYLKSIGCFYIQGYLYSKPLTVDDYEKAARNAGKEERLIALEKIDNLDNNTFWDPKSLDTLIFNSYVGGACIYEWQDDSIEVIRANSKFAQVFGGTGMSIDEILKLDWFKHFDEADQEKHRRAMELSAKSKEEVSGEFIFRNLPGCPSNTWIRSSHRVIAIAGERLLVYCMVENITAQREAEQSNSEKADRLRLIMENVYGGITASVFKDDGIIQLIFANDRYYSMLGYTKEQWDAEVPDVFELLYPDDRSRIRAAVQNVIRSGENDVYEYRCVKRSGELMYMRCYASLTKMAGIEGEVLLSFTQDISGLAFAEQRASDSSSQLQAIMDNINGGVSAAVVNEKGTRFIFANDRYYEQLGCTRSQFEKKAASCSFMIIHPDDRDMVRDMAIQGTRFGRPYSCVYRVIWPNGTVRWIQSNVSITKIPCVDEPVHLAVANDITAQREAEQKEHAAYEKLRELSETMQTLMNDTPGGFARLKVQQDGVAKLIYINEGMCRLLGASRDEIMSDTDNPQRWGLHPDDTAAVRAATAKALETGKSGAPIRHRLRTKDGGYVWVEAVCRITRNNAGETFLNVYYKDLSDQENEELKFQDMLPVALSAMMSSSSDISFVKDTNLKYVCCSRAFADAAGMESESDIVGKCDRDIVDSELAELYRADDLEIIQSGKPTLNRLDPLPSKNGLKRYASTSKYPLLGKSGNVIGIYGTARDITESREVLSRLQLLTDNVNGGLATYEFSPASGVRAVYTSDGVVSLTGYTREEHAAAAYDGQRTLVFEEDRPLVYAQLMRLMNDGTPVNCTYRIRVKDGGFRWINFRGVISERKKDSVIVNAVLFDVTDLKTADEERRADDERNRILVENLGSLIFDYDYGSDTLTYKVNRHGSGFSTIVQEHYLANLDSGRSAVHPDYVKSYRAAFAEAVRCPAANGTFEYVANNWGTGYRRCLARYVSIADENGKVTRVVGVTTETDDETKP